MILSRANIRFAGAGRIEPLIGVVDGFYASDHEVRVRTTGYPVESGATLTDHAVREPIQLKLQGWVSDIMAAREVERPINSGRSARAWDDLVQLADAKEPLTVNTQIGTYRNMLITKIQTPLDRTTSRALRFTMELQEILFTNIGLSFIPPGRPPTGPVGDLLQESEIGHIQARPVQSPTARPVPSPTAQPRPSPTAQPRPIEESSPWAFLTILNYLRIR